MFNIQAMLGTSASSKYINQCLFVLFFLGMPIWSKLQSGRLPQPEELFDIINNQIHMSGNTEKF